MELTLPPVTSDDEEEDVMRVLSPSLSRSNKVLKYTWVVWVDRSEKGMTEEEYMEGLQEIYKFNTMKQFNELWERHNMSSRLKSNTNVRVFKEGVAPVWEDPANADGGKWLLSFSGIKLKHALEHWVSLMTGLCGNRFADSRSLVGAVLGMRTWGCMMTLWNTDAHHGKQIAKVKRKLRKLFNLQKVKYQIHQASIHKNAEVRSGETSPNSTSPQQGRKTWRSNPSSPRGGAGSSATYASATRNRQRRALSGGSAAEMAPQQHQQQAGPSSSVVVAQRVADKLRAGAAGTEGLAASAPSIVLKADADGIDPLASTETVAPPDSPKAQQRQESSKAPAQHQDQQKRQQQQEKRQQQQQGEAKRGEQVQSSTSESSSSTNKSRTSGSRKSDRSRKRTSLRLTRRSREKLAAAALVSNQTKPASPSSAVVQGHASASAAPQSSFLDLGTVAMVLAVVLALASAFLYWAPRNE